jgi:hypothetical protein
MGGCGAAQDHRRSSPNLASRVDRPLLALLFLGVVVSRVLSADVSPLPQAHAHNDYMHVRPLLDALDQGFCSVEADIHLVDGALLVAHDRWLVKPERTLQSLYLDPLRERVRKNGGRVYPNGPGVTLLIDQKTDAVATYEVLRKVLQDYAEILTEFRDDRVRTNAVTVFISGNRPVDVLTREPVRLAGLDGRPGDLEANPSNRVVPLVSESWTALFKWRGEGEMPAVEHERLVALVKKAHEQGRRIRFWSGLDGPALWKVQRDAGVDLINTDKLVELRAFLLGGKEK